MTRPALVLGALVLAAACGKKGAPLAPIVRIPAGIENVRAERLGNDVYLTLTVPAANIDRSVPVDISRIDVYAYTGRTLPPRDRFVEAATLVATIPVVVPPTLPAGPTPPGTPTPPTPPNTPTPPTLPNTPTPPVPGAAPGAVITVIDTLTPEELVQGTELAPTPEELRRARTLPPPVAPVATVAGPLRRYYLAVGFSSRGRPGPQGTPAEFALIEPPLPPSELAASVGDVNATLTWSPAGGLIGFLLDPQLPPEPSPNEDVFALPVPGAPVAPAPVIAGPTRYNVYKLSPLPPPDPTVPPAPAGAAADLPWLRVRPRPLNLAPLSQARLADSVVFGVEHCYVVRGVRGDGPAMVEGAPSDRFCFTPADTFPPLPPAGLVAVAAEGSISLIWEPAGDLDLAGYVVLRGSPGDATLQPLTTAPVTAASYVDTTATAGTRYVYAVQAIDTANNVSMESNRVEETGR